MSKSFILGFIVGLALLIVAGVGASRLKQQDAEQQKYQAELADATPLRFDMLSKKPNIHSNLYNGLGQSENDKPITELISIYKGKKIVYGIDVMVRREQEFTGSETPENYFGELARASDAVIRGRVTKKSSQITEDQKFLFTDYDVEVKEVFKNNAIALLTTGAMITVTLPGGKVLIDDVIVKAGGNSMAALPINNHDVVLFLKSLQESQDYKLTRYNGSFELAGRSVRPLAGRFPPGFLQDENSFLKIVQAVSNK